MVDDGLNGDTSLPQLEQGVDFLRQKSEFLKEVGRDPDLLRSSRTVRLGFMQVVTASPLFAALRAT